MTTQEVEPETKILTEQLEDSKAPPVVATAEDDIEKVVPHRAWKFAYDYVVNMKGDDVPQHWEREYIQKPLSYHGMMEFTGLMGRVLDHTMSGPEGLSLERLVSMADNAKLPVKVVDGKLSVSDDMNIEGIDEILRGILRFMSSLPDLLREAQCMWLRVPRAERAMLDTVWAQAPGEGGMSMREGEEMLSLFIEQNYEELAYFFGKWWTGVASAVQRARKRAGAA